MPRHKFWPYNVRRVKRGILLFLLLLIMMVMVMRMNKVSIQKDKVELLCIKAKCMLHWGQYELGGGMNGMIRIG